LLSPVAPSPSTSLLPVAQLPSSLP
jgi:hypothetical protein